MMEKIEKILGYAFGFAVALLLCYFLANHLVVLAFILVYAISVKLEERRNKEVNDNGKSKL